MQPKRDENQMSFYEHLDALRPHLVRSALLFCALFVAAFLCKGVLIDSLLFGPLQAPFPTNRLLMQLAVWSGIDYTLPSLTGMQLINTTMAGQFNLHLQIAAIAAFAATLPYLVWELWRFVKPALHPHEKAACRSLAGRVVGAFLLGIAFGYLVIAPLAVNFLAGYTASSEIVNMIDARSYLSTVIQSTLACALLFQLPLLVQLLSRMGLLTAAWMRRYRRHAILTLALLAALITPPDAFSMVLVLIPLMGLYEYSIRVAERNAPKAETDA
ncbi:MAG: twin-arginine translocase subunit TatC [Rikenellaceae bacterium]|nr:twin-arginine translocase subunit TatC [Rikenellaceae bacterium]